MLSSLFDLFDYAGSFPGDILELTDLFDSAWGSVRSLISLAGLVLLCIALYILSKRRGYDKPWLGAIPIVNGYALGGIADNICYYKGKRTHFRIWLLVGNILTAVMSLLAFGALLTLLMALVSAIGFDRQSGFYFGLGLALSILLLVAVGAIIVCHVFRCIALYHVYMDYAPNLAVVFLLLTIFLGAFCPEGIILFVLRNKTPVSLTPAAPPPPAYSPYTYR